MLHFIDPKPEMVRLWTQREIPHGKAARVDKDLTVEYEKLRAGLLKLKCPNGYGMHAGFHSKLGTNSDLENILFYNIGNSAFSKTISSFVRFEHIRNRPPQSPDGNDHNCYYEYRISKVEKINHLDKRLHS